MGTVGFPRTARLLRPSEFNALREKSARVSSRYFYAQYRYTTSATARLGMAVSRRVSKRAVVRNRIKRQLRESFRQQRCRLPKVDILVIAKTIASETTLVMLREDLTRLWKKLAALHSLQPSETMFH